MHLRIKHIFLTSVCLFLNLDGEVPIENLLGCVWVKSEDSGLEYHIRFESDGYYKESWHQTRSGQRRSFFGAYGISHGKLIRFNQEGGKIWEESISFTEDGKLRLGDSLYAPEHRDDIPLTFPISGEDKTRFQQAIALAKKDPPTSASPNIQGESTIVLLTEKLRISLEDRKFDSFFECFLQVPEVPDYNRRIYVVFLAWAYADEPLTVGFQETKIEASIGPEGRYIFPKNTTPIGSIRLNASRHGTEFFVLQKGDIFYLVPGYFDSQSFPNL